MRVLAGPVFPLLPFILFYFHFFLLFFLFLSVDHKTKKWYPYFFFEETKTGTEGY